MKNYISSKLLKQAVEELSKLPSIGERSALRLALYILQQDKSYTYKLTDALNNLRENIKYCKICHNISDTDICNICNNDKRDHSVVLVIENIRDFIALENTNQHNGLYHILGGVISPINGVGISDLNINSLLNRIEKNNIEEVILALPTTIEGDTTSLYLYKKLSELNVKITTIARGVAFGDDLEYTDQITLGRSIINRIPFNG
ncbi:MAG: recombination mediator RecR [Bacteroidales bacterium]